ncbi:hypothetical protein VPNG_04387 [Cytospora leucostoma]|uniref:Uncharacterized protein n=1 Tax=Cytospora leucostoma TaxID=1230097 RepID=A0A423XC00_9PEZI|nr:hypothetical protein VPNG_04387 [Cytospora leucostoma]
MANHNVASQAATQALIAQAKAEIAIALTEQFQRDINGLRDALEHANQLITTLKNENANLKAALANAVEGYDFNNIPDAGVSGGGIGGADGSGNGGNPELQRPPPEGTIFSNGNAYNPSKTERGNTRLKEELNAWTQARGYSVKILRSKLAGTRAKLVVSCVYAGSPRYREGQHETAEEEQRRKEKARTDGYRFYKKRTSKLRDCPMRFMLHEVIQGSGTFVVKHSDAPEHQRCNHEPEPLPEADEGGASILSQE